MPESQTFLYEQVYHELRQMIENQTYQPGERLPSMRQFSRSRRISMATVMQAYDLLQVQGLIEIRPQSGVYVRAVAPHPLPRTTRQLPVPRLPERDHLIAGLVDRLRQPGILPLGSTALSLALLPVKALNRLVSRVAQQDLSHAYAPTPGLASLRRQIALRSVDSGRPLRAEDVLITCGGMEALNLALRCLTRTGDLVAVESPTFWGILQALECLGLRSLEIPTHADSGLDLDALEQALHQHPIKVLVTVPSFQNPLGCCLSLDKKRALLDLAARFDFQIIEDDVYGEFYYQTPPPTLFALDRSERVLLCSSFSKTLAPGFRVGWALPGPHADRFEKLKRMSTLSTASLPQQVIAEYLASGAYDRHLRRLRRQLQQNTAQALGMIASCFPPEIRVSQPQGGFVLWLECPYHWQLSGLLDQCLAQGFSIAPGQLFSVQNDFSHCFRLSLNQAWGPDLERVLDWLGKHFFKLADSV